MVCGVGASGMPRPTMDCTAHRDAFAPVRGWTVPGAALVDGPRRPPRRGGGADHGPWPGIAPSADGALGRLGCFARCGGREFRWLRPATRGAASGHRDLGCPPPVGKSGRRGILRQAKVWLRRHTGCMARSHTAGMAEKARRAPQTHGWWAALTRKKSSKTF